MRDACSPASLGRKVATLDAAVLCAAVAHFRIREWLRASLTSGVWFFYFSLVDSYIHRGNGIHPRPAEWLVSTLYGFAVASLVAVLFVTIRHDPKPWRAS